MKVTLTAWLLSGGQFSEPLESLTALTPRSETSLVQHRAARLASTASLVEGVWTSSDCDEQHRHVGCTRQVAASCADPPRAPEPSTFSQADWPKGPCARLQQSCQFVICLSRWVSSFHGISRFFTAFSLFFSRHFLDQFSPIFLNFLLLRVNLPNNCQQLPEQCVTKQQRLSSAHCLGSHAGCRCSSRGVACHMNLNTPGRQTQCGCATRRC